MKKVISFLAIGLVLAAFVPGTAFGKKGARQDVTGHIALQAPPAEGTNDPNGCYAGVHRRIAVATQEQVNGVVGFHFDVDPATWNKKFRLTPTTEGVDIDILFYSEFGTLEQATDPAYAPFNVTYEERDTEGEAGKIPADVTRALVCMKVGNDADFTYSGGAGVK